MKITLLIGASLLLALTLTATAMSPRSQRIAEDKNSIGKWGLSECSTFAEAKARELHKAGFEACVIEFSWTDGVSGGNHAYVAYKNEKGLWMGIDNRMFKAKHLIGVDSDEWTKNLYPSLKTVVFDVK